MRGFDGEPDHIPALVLPSCCVIPVIHDPGRVCSSWNGNSSPTDSAWSYSVTLPVPSARAWLGPVPAMNIYAPQICVLT
jgi:hypothetical protein